MVAAALFVAFFAVAVPAILLMTVWAGVMAFRLLFPERTLPFDAPARRQRAAAYGEFRPVKLRDILEDQQAQRATVARGGETPEPHPLFDDLWLRRN